MSFYKVLENVAFFAAVGALLAGQIAVAAFAIGIACYYKIERLERRP